MTDDVLKSPIEYLKGVGPKRAQLLQKELGIFTFDDLLRHYPFRYVDRSIIYPIRSVVSTESHIQVFGRITSVRRVGGARLQRISATLEDETGQIELVWFKSLRWISESIREGQTYLVYGKPTRFKSQLNIVHPEMEEKSSRQGAAGPPLHPVYPSTDKLNNNGLGSRAISKLMIRLHEQSLNSVQESLSGKILDEVRLIPLRLALKNVHFPENNEMLAKAIFRIKFDELFFVQLRLLRQKLVNRNKYKGFVFEKIGDFFNRFYKEFIPFELTEAQKRVIKEIRRDLNSGNQMNRLLQGDVGSGKTMVAALSVLIALDNGFQACLMAPTEILANQHAANLRQYLEPLGVKIHLLSGSVKASDRVPILEELKNGTCHMVIGTHALIEDKVVFKNLGLAVIDEQHRFGVAQRAKLWKKNSNPPHVLVMTATPIPRTLAMTLYGDLDISIIDELPPGRKEIETVHRKDNSRMKVFGFLEQQIDLGRQVYIVYPLIEESQKLDYKDLMDGYESITRRFPKPKYQVSIVHGKMKSEDKDFEMKRFQKGETQIMVATTVIEVGVDIPNASVMVIESAERFGLSQLHQLRGRVGRGAEQSYCIMMTGYKLSEEGRTRLESMVRTNDGFEIAEVDLKLRGPGDFHGTQQSGLPMELKLTNLSKDNQIVGIAREKADATLSADPNLEQADNFPILKTFKKLHAKKINWARIS
ncbi:MAG TPA: ATP-dependent DNA helicase RecG [Flavobacteriales bacterium]|nr:ATP-dependent DNA helicase RecG [Flavobacteriales bacterium]